MPAQIDLDQKHAFYLKLEPERCKSRDLFEGPTVVKARAQEYLFKTANETATQYELRLRRAVYDNWVEVVVASRMALQWRKAPIRELPPKLAELVADVDGLLTDADTFFMTQCENSSVDGLSCVMVDQPPPPPVEGRPASKLEEEAAGVRPYFFALMAEDVLDWAWGKDHELDYAVVVRQVVDKPGPGLGSVCHDQRLVWKRDVWELYELENQGEGESTVKVWTMIDAGANPIGKVPLVPFYGRKVQTGYGRPVTVDILDHAISIYNKFSDRDFSEFMTNNPIPYVIAPDNPGNLSVAGGAGLWLSSRGQAQVACGYLEPSGKGVDSSRTSERDLIRRIFEISLRQMKKDTAQVESAESQRQGQAVFVGSLSSTATTMEESEIQVWELAALWMKDSEAEIEIEYNRDYQDATITAEMVTAFSYMVEKHQLSVETFLEILKAGEVLPTDTVVSEELSRIEADRDKAASSMPLFGNLPSLNPGAPPEPDPNAPVPPTPPG